MSVLTPIKYYTHSLASEIMQEKEVKGIQIRMSKMSLFRDHIIIRVDHLQESTKNFTK